MKFNKKLLALLLSLSVIFTSFGVMAETPVTIAAREIPIESAEYDILNALGFIGEDVKILNGDSAFSRAQFIGILFKVAGFADVEYSPEKLTFEDVTESNVYKDEIQYFYNAGYINGTSATTFSPASPITYQQAAKIICDLLGYKDFAISRYGNDMSAFASMAQRIDLNHNMSVTSYTAPLTAQNAIIMLYNAGRAKVFDPSYYTENGDVVYDNWNGDELFAKSGIYYGTGRMQSNGIVSIVSAEPNKEYAKINGVNYKLSDADLTGLVGLNVEFHYKVEKGEKTLLWAGIKGNNAMLELQASELEPGDARYDMDTIVYKDGKKKLLAELDPFCDVIYNNALYNSYNLSHIQPEMGFIRLVNTDSDEEYDLVIVEEYDNVFAIKYSSDLAYISDKYNNPIKLDEYKSVKIYRDGKEIRPDDIGVNVVLTCVRAVNKESIVIYANSEIYSTKLLGIVQEAGETTLEFEAVKAKFAPSYENLDTSKYTKVEPKMGKLYTVYLDKEGNVAEITEGSDQILQYAYVIDAWANDERNAEPNSAVFRLLLANGSFATATTKKKIRLDGVPGKTGQDILDDTRLWKDILDGGGNVIGTTVNEQVVRVTINEDGEITEFEFAYDNTANPYGFYDGKFSLDHVGTNSISDSDYQYMLSKRYTPDGATKIFVKYAGLDKEEPYGVVARGSYKPVSGTKIKIYDSNSARVPAVAAGEMIFGGDYNDMYAFLVEGVVYKIVDGEYVKHIAGWYGNAWKEMPEYSEGIIPASVKRGDIVRVAVSSNKITKCADPAHLADKPAPYVDGNQRFSYLYSMSPQAICITTPAGQESTYGNIMPVPLKSNQIPIKVYDVKNDEITLKSMADVAPLKAPEADGTFVPEESDVMIYLYAYRGAYITDVIVVLY